MTARYGTMTFPNELLVSYAEESIAIDIDSKIGKTQTQHLPGSGMETDDSREEVVRDKKNVYLAPRFLTKGGGGATVKARFPI